MITASWFGTHESSILHELKRTPERYQWQGEVMFCNQQSQCKGQQPDARGTSKWEFVQVPGSSVVLVSCQIMYRTLPDQELSSLPRVAYVLQVRKVPDVPVERDAQEDLGQKLRDGCCGHQPALFPTATRARSSSSQAEPSNGEVGQYSPAAGALGKADCCTGLELRTAPKLRAGW